MSEDNTSAAGAPPFDPWQPIATAPKDGTPFYSLSILTDIGVGMPARVSLSIQILRRMRSNPESAGYWENMLGWSVANDMAGALWAPLGALPIHHWLAAREMESRRYEIYQPHDLPVPFGSGLVLPEGAVSGEKAGITQAAEGSEPKAKS